MRRGGQYELYSGRHVCRVDARVITIQMVVKVFSEGRFEDRRLDESRTDARDPYWTLQRPQFLSQPLGECAHRVFGRGIEVERSVRRDVMCQIAKRSVQQFKSHWNNVIAIINNTVVTCSGG